MEKANQEFYPRDFEGVWIPREIYLNEKLNALDKIIFTEINSLDRHLSGGDYCFASNAYLAKFCGCGVTKVSTTISKLIKMGYLQIVRTDGRRRWIKSLLKERLSKNERQTSENCKANFQEVKESNIDDNNNYQYKNINNKESNSDCSVLKTDIETKAGQWEWKSDKQYIDYIEKVLPKMIRNISSEFGKNSNSAYEVFLMITGYYFNQYKIYNGQYHVWYREDTLRECFNALFEFFDGHLVVGDVKDYIDQFFSHKKLREKPFKVFCSYNMLEILKNEFEDDWHN